MVCVKGEMYGNRNVRGECPTFMALTMLATGIAYNLMASTSPR